ncbi:MAG: hypothetical protein NTX25_14845 [Proteobacteria bacterium]|nr:hypothetical protein [Pseudomonadota bacterium]
MSLDLLAGFNLEALELKLKVPPTVDASLRIKKLRLGYSIWGLLQRRLNLSEVLVEGVRGDVTLVLAVEPPPAEAAPSNLAAMLAFLRQAPLQLDSPLIEWRDTQLNVRLSRGPLHLEAMIDQLDFKAAVSLQKRLIKLESQANLHMGLQLWQDPLTKEALRLKTQLQLRPELSVHLSLADEKAQWDIGLKHLGLELDELELVLNSLKNPAKTVKIRQLAYDLACDLSRQGQVTDRPSWDELLLPLKIQGTQHVKLQGLSLLMNTADTAEPLHVDARAEQTLAAELISLSEGSWSSVGLIELDKEPWFNFQTKAADAKGRLEAQLELRLRTPRSLLGQHPSFALLKRLGLPSLNLTSSLELVHPHPLVEFKKAKWPELTITNFLQMKLEQEGTDHTQFFKFKNLELSSELHMPARKAGQDSSQLKEKLHLTSREWSMPRLGLKKPIDIEQDIQLSSQISDRIDGHLDAHTYLDKNKLLGIEADWHDAPSHFDLESMLQIDLTPSLMNIHEAAQALDLTGAMHIESQQSLQLNHGFDRLLAMKTLDLEKMDLKARLKQVISQAQGGQNQSKMLWPKPIELTTQVSLIRNRLAIETDLLAHELAAQKQFRLQGLRLKLKAGVKNIQSMADAQFSLKAAALQLELLRKFPEEAFVQRLLHNLMLSVQGSLKHQNQLTIESLVAKLGRDFFQFKGAGAFRTSGQGHFDAAIDAKLGEQTKDLLQGQGQLHIPIKLVMFDKTRLLLDARPDFQNLSVQLQDFQAKNINGTLQIHEELELDAAHRIGFLYLDTQSPFARVDYESVDPYVDEHSLLSLEQIKYKHIELGPLISKFEIRQNLLLLNQLKMDLLKGSALGRFYLDLHPERLLLGFLGRFSGIKTELLKEPHRRTAPSEWAPLGGRIALNFDLRKRLATGRLDLNSIGKPQLLGLLDALDPDYKDEQMTMARRALQVAYPEAVALSMEQGLMDLNIRLGGLISKDIAIRSIPLSGLINAYAGEAIQSLEQRLQTGAQ